MAYFDIAEEDIDGLTGKVTIISGASSGIGLATTHLFLSKGAIVIGIDLRPPVNAVSSDNFSFHKTDVTSWTELANLFRAVYNKHGRIDIVCANAGIIYKNMYISLEQDGSGNLLQPSHQTIQVNLVAVSDQVSLAFHYMQLQTPKGGSIILTASGAGYVRFGAHDYVAAKHAVIGMLRSLIMRSNTAEVPVRVNAVAPSWTQSGLAPLSSEDFARVGVKDQPASAVAKSIGLLAVDARRHGQCLYSYGGRYIELEGPVQEATVKAMGKTGLGEEDERLKIIQRMNELKAVREGGQQHQLLRT